MAEPVDEILPRTTISDEEARRIKRRQREFESQTAEQQRRIHDTQFARAHADRRRDERQAIRNQTARLAYVRRERLKAKRAEEANRERLRRGQIDRDRYENARIAIQGRLSKAIGGVTPRFAERETNFTKDGFTDVTNFIQVGNLTSKQKKVLEDFLQQNLPNDLIVPKKTVKEINRAIRLNRPTVFSSLRKSLLKEIDKFNPHYDAGRIQRTGDYASDLDQFLLKVHLFAGGGLRTVFRESADSTLTFLHKAYNHGRLRVENPAQITKDATKVYDFAVKQFNAAKKDPIGYAGLVVAVAAMHGGKVTKAYVDDKVKRWESGNLKQQGSAVIGLVLDLWILKSGGRVALNRFDDIKSAAIVGKSKAKKLDLVSVPGKPLKSGRRPGKVGDSEKQSILEQAKQRDLYVSAQATDPTRWWRASKTTVLKPKDSSFQKLSPEYKKLYRAYATDKPLTRAQAVKLSAELRRVGVWGGAARYELFFRPQKAKEFLVRLDRIGATGGRRLDAFQSVIQMIKNRDFSFRKRRPAILVADAKDFKVANLEPSLVRGYQKSLGARGGNVDPKFEKQMYKHILSKDSDIIPVVFATTEPEAILRGLYRRGKTLGYWKIGNSWIPIRQIKLVKDVKQKYLKRVKKEIKRADAYYNKIIKPIDKEYDKIKSTLSSKQKQTYKNQHSSFTQLLSDRVTSYALGRALRGSTASTAPIQNRLSRSPSVRSPPGQSPPSRSPPPGQSPPSRSPPTKSPPVKSPPSRSPSRTLVSGKSGKTVQKRKTVKRKVKKSSIKSSGVKGYFVFIGNKRLTKVPLSKGDSLDYLSHRLKESKKHKIGFVRPGIGAKRLQELDVKLKGHFLKYRKSYKLGRRLNAIVLQKVK